MFPTIRSLTEACCAAFAAVLLVSCGFKAPAALQTPAGLYQALNTAPYATPYSSERWSVVDDRDSNGMRIDHGYSCVRTDRAASRDYLGIRIQEQAELDNNQNATVFLNGWSSAFEGDDHHVTGVGSIIFNIARNDDVLTWDAGGVLSDKKGDDAYEWCYNYTILYWPTNNFDIRPTHSDSTGQLLFLQDPNYGTAVHAIPGSFTSPNNKVPRAALPSGFAMAWHSSDHHLAQIGFKLGMPTLAQKTLSWSSRTILKDNARRRSYRAAEAVTILSGRNIKVIQPEEVFVLENDIYVPKPNDLEFEPLPKTDCPGVQLSGPTSVIRNYRITGLDTDYAVPMLSGFELSFSCDDQHVKTIGAKIRDFWYQPPGDGVLGTLDVQVETTFTDKDRIPEMNDLTEVTVLGINELP